MTPWSSLIVRRFRDGSKVQRGMAFMMVSTLTGSRLVAAARHLGTDIHPFEIVFFRSFFGLVFFAPWLIRLGLAPLRTRHIILHGVRSGLQVATALAFFTALTMAPQRKRVIGLWDLPKGTSTGPLKKVRRFGEVSTFENYNSEHSMDSGSRKIEFTLKSTTFLDQ